MMALLSIMLLAAPADDAVSVVADSPQKAIKAALRLYGPSIEVSGLDAVAGRLPRARRYRARVLSVGGGRVVCAVTPRGGRTRRLSLHIRDAALSEPAGVAPAAGRKNCRVGRAGDHISVERRFGGLRVTTKGRLLRSGCIGDEVSVAVGGTHQTLRVVLRAPGQGELVQ